jgi:hypothetical protein
MRLGLYDTEGKRSISEKAATIEEAGTGAYVTVDLGAHELPEGTYFWAAPVNNPDEVEAVYVDRVFFVREK